MKTFLWIPLITFLVHDITSSGSDPTEITLFEPLWMRIASMIGNVRNKHPGKFDLWIFQLSSWPLFDVIVSNALQRGEMKYIPRRMVSSSGLQNIAADQGPGALIVLLDQNVEASLSRSLSRALQLLDPHLYVLAIFPFSRRKPPSRVQQHFIPNKMMNVLYIPLDPKDGEYLLIQISLLSGRVTYCDESNAPGVLFPDQLSNLHGSELKVGAYRDPPFIDLPLGIDLQMTSLILQTINASMRFGMSTSSEKETRLGFRLDRQISLNRSSMLVWTMLPYSYVIVVERGRLLTLPEIFMEPFHNRVWIAIGFIVLLSYLAMWIFPLVFQNNIILLAICGIEYHDLNRTSRIEKLIVMSLMILFFLLTCGYEARIMSSLTEWPRLPDFKTVDELANEGLKIGANFLFLPNFVRTNPKLSQSLINYTDSFGVKNRVALLDSYNAARIWIKHDSFIEGSSNRRRFKILEEHFGQFFPGYYFGSRNTLRRKFELLQRRIFESGIYSHWLEQYETRKTGGQLKLLQGNDLTEDDTLLVSTHSLFPAWMLVFICWGTCVAVLAIELIVQKFHASRMRNRVVYFNH